MEKKGNKLGSKKMIHIDYEVEIFDMQIILKMVIILELLVNLEE